MEKSREQYIKNIVPGNIVAFKNGTGMYSGKVEAVEGTTYTIRTKNCSVYYIEAEDIVWVKNGTHWPIGIFNALKARKE